jgi:hypothetical protein
MESVLNHPFSRWSGSLPLEAILGESMATPLQEDQAMSQVLMSVHFK